MSEQAARQSDPVGHGLGLLGMVAGALIGAAVGALLVVGAVASGGTLLIAMSVCAAGACVAGGGLSGGQLARGIQKALNLEPTTGNIATGSVDVLIGWLPAARAKQDIAAVCDGLFGFNHFLMPSVPIAEGAATVLINSYPAARVKDRLICGAKINEGAADVRIGGPTVQVLPINDLEGLFEEALSLLLEASLIGMLLCAYELGLLAEVLIGLLEFVVISEGLGYLGDYLGPGWRDILQGAFGLAAIISSGKDAKEKLDSSKDFVDNAKSEIADTRSKHNIKEGEKNVAIGELDANGQKTTYEPSVSGKTKEGTLEGNGKYADKTRKLTDTEKGHKGPRKTDSEVKILERASTDLEGNPNADGTLRIFTEREPCPSCKGVIEAFKTEHPNINVEVFWEDPSTGQKFWY